MSAQNEECKAWLFKLEQVYKKAVISMENEPEFAIIKEVYDSINRKMKFHKTIFFILIGIMISFLLFGSLISLGGIGIFAIIVMIIAVVTVLYMNKDKVFKRRK